MIERMIPLVVIALGVATTHADTSAAIRAQFASPSRDFSTGPLWTWNDMLATHLLMPSASAGT